MPINNIDIYSSEYKRMVFKPSVSFSGRNILVSTGEFEYDGYIYHLDEDVLIELPQIMEDSHIKIYFVEDILTKELFVVTDFSALQNLDNVWEPDLTQHKILFKFIEGTIYKDNDSLDKDDIFVYSIDLPKQNFLN